MIEANDEPVAVLGLRLRTSSVLLDVGGNSGVVSLPWLLSPANHTVYTWEPTPRMVDILCISSALAGHYGGRWTVYEGAVGAKEERLTLRIVPLESHSSPTLVPL